MSFLQTFSLSVIQGITEFVPISSSGHLILLPELLGWEDQGLAFDVVVHLGTLFAILVFFWRKLWSILTSFL
jgi:undecaprenyl-diphosphatase